MALVMIRSFRTWGMPLLRTIPIPDSWQPVIHEVLDIHVNLSLSIPIVVTPQDVGDPANMTTMTRKTLLMVQTQQIML
jgi:hypothetical protein